MSLDLAFLKLYKGEAAELAELERLSESWSGRDFWALSEILLSLRIPRTFLIYAPGPGGWRGIAFGRMLGTSAELFYIYVDPAARGSGLGQDLLAAFIAHAAQEFAAEEVFLEVRPSNSSALRLYERLGFREQGRRKRYYTDGEDALVFTKNIPHTSASSP